MGAEALREYLRISRQSQSGLARDLGTTRQAVQGWCSGAVRPGLWHALMLHKKAGIPPDSWLDPVQRLALQASVVTKVVDTGDRRE